MLGVDWALRVWALRVDGLSRRSFQSNLEHLLRAPPGEVPGDFLEMEAMAFVPLRQLRKAAAANNPEYLVDIDGERLDVPKFVGANRSKRWQERLDAMWTAYGRDRLPTRKEQRGGLDVTKILLP